MHMWIESIQGMHSTKLVDIMSPSLIPGSFLPSFLSHTVQKIKMGREPGQFDRLRNDVLCVVSCVVWVIELSPTHAVLERSNMLETESPCSLSQYLMLLKIRGRSPNETTANNCES